MRFASMRALLAQPDLPGRGRLHLHYALGKAHEDQGDYAAAFTQFSDGATLRRAETAHDADVATTRMLRTQAVFTKGFFAARAGGGSLSKDPIFIVGLPRSGSTIVEQILASHSAVEGVMELPNMRWITEELGAPDRYPEGLTALDHARLGALGRAYIDATRIHRKLGRPYFIDKMPNNSTTSALFT